MSQQRQIDRYDPRLDASSRWPAWAFHFTELRGLSAVVSGQKQLVLLDRTVWRDRERIGVAQAVVYLDLGLHELPTVTKEQVKLVEDIAQLRLDLDEWRDQL